MRFEKSKSKKLFPYLFDTIPLWMAERQILDISEYQSWPFGGDYQERKKRTNSDK